MSLKLLTTFEVNSILAESYKGISGKNSLGEQSKILANLFKWLKLYLALYFGFSIFPIKPEETSNK